MTDEPEILVEKNGRAGVIVLNRPKALNALTRTMVHEMHRQLIEWADDASIELVIVRAAGEKAFCAGGDIRQLHDWGRAGDPAIRAFYHEEYRLNTYIKTYPKPYVALIDGIVMGGGVGVSIHGSRRIAGDRIMFAMPETGIGLFPDVGGTYFLPRLPGRTGTWLALTGARLGQADAVWCGLATHAISSDRVDDLAQALGEDGGIDATIGRFSKPPAEDAPLASLQDVIERCFSAATVEEILERLDAERGGHADWAAKQAATIRTKSPTSLKIALRQMQEGAKADFEECMRIEYRIVNRVITGHEFFEGVRAVIIDKDGEPKWAPASLPEVDEADVDAYFAPLPDELDLSALDSVSS
ncbi:enoyl-CoA hydratase/isomerase family protein [Aquamicrobium sp. LC103]|uniref:enoyl-CoA hydratase/isomerase family protein n=1 Tax=Aquamicrobium sp. LC103 TaxID=1120658 RepID=UPI00063EA6B5|nr:enoyl-CoA hydratase/isomerase family protein [Aquamicrobium sp. LC103]TKT80965.1 enoyl-CoA hydratase/isomerase family protein [Aquamicrobium sp. LC103]